MKNGAGRGGRRGTPPTARRTLADPLAAIVLIGVLCVPALAQVPTSVTLKTSSERIRFGRSVVLSGKVSPPSPNEEVQIIDGKGRVRAETRTEADGGYRVRISPRHTSKLRARWIAALSDPVVIRVKPLLNVKLRRVRLFGRAGIKGSLRPAHPGDHVNLAVFRNGRKISSREARLHDGRTFFVPLKVGKPGTYRVRAAFDDHDHLRVVERSRRRSTPLPQLASGSGGIYVKLLEKRLRRLQYHVPRPDRSFDFRTADAVMAFNKVQGRARVGSVDAGTWRALARPIRPRPRAKRPRLHIEVDQTRQVLYVVRKGRIDDTIHVSTGAGGATYDGAWKVYRKIAGYSPHRLYYPSYYEGARAIHGWPEVPNYPASHGCVRVPYWTAKWIHRIAQIGVEVRIYH
jgi:hypothetical protein